MTKLFIIIGLVFSFITNTFADQPHPWQISSQVPATNVMMDIKHLSSWKHDILIAMVVFIILIMTYIFVKFRKKNNPVASKTAHNTSLEIVWSIIPVIIVGVILVPSLKLLYKIDKIPDCEMTIKIIAHQWYWEYQYPDHGGFGFDSMIIPKDKLQSDQLRLYTTDNKLVLPVNTNIKLLITSADVIHAWGVPSFGVKKDAIPGRVNETWLNVNSTGTYYGHCYELCGINHGFMPINVEVKSKEDFQNWVKDAQKKFAFNSKENLYLLASN